MTTKQILLLVGGSIALLALLFLCLGGIWRNRRKRRGAKHLARSGQGEADEETKLKKELGTMDRILIILGIFLFLFVITMIVIFCVKGATPDTLIMSVFGLCAVEGGVMGWIKTRKEKIRAKLRELSQATTDAQDGEEMQ